MHRHKILNRGFFLKVTRRHSFALLHMDPKPVQVLLFIATYVKNLSRQCLNFISTRDRETHSRMEFKNGRVDIKLQIGSRGSMVAQGIVWREAFVQNERTRLLQCVSVLNAHESAGVFI